MGMDQKKLRTCIRHSDAGFSVTGNTGFWWARHGLDSVQLAEVDNFCGLKPPSVPQQPKEQPTLQAEVRNFINEPRKTSTIDWLCELGAGANRNTEKSKYWHSQMRFTPGLATCLGWDV
jgi:hypothetical protein